jgi:hypothetical protein
LKKVKKKRSVQGPTAVYWKKFEKKEQSGKKRRRKRKDVSKIEKKWYSLHR